MVMAINNAAVNMGMNLPWCVYALLYLVSCVHVFTLSN